MEAEVKIDDVRTFETSGGNMRYVMRDADGKEYTTFREAIGEAAKRPRAAGPDRVPREPARAVHERLPRQGRAAAGRGAGAADTDPDEAAWRTAVEAAPWLVGESEPHEEVPPEELYEKLRPFKDKVAEDIKEGES